jgi:hypothetical protein
MEGTVKQNFADGGGRPARTLAEAPLNDPNALHGGGSPAPGLEAALENEPDAPQGGEVQAAARQELSGNEPDRRNVDWGRFANLFGIFVTASIAVATAADRSGKAGFLVLLLAAVILIAVIVFEQKKEKQVGLVVLRAFQSRPVILALMLAAVVAVAVRVVAVAVPASTKHAPTTAGAQRTKRDGKDAKDESGAKDGKQQDTSLLQAGDPPPPPPAGWKTLRHSEKAHGAFREAADQIGKTGRGECDMEIFKNSITALPDLDAGDKDCWSLVMYAAKEGSPKCLEALLQRGAHVYVSTPAGAQPWGIRWHYEAAEPAAATETRKDFKAVLNILNEAAARERQAGASKSGVPGSPK